SRSGLINSIGAIPKAPSSSGLGRRPLKAVARVQIPSGLRERRGVPAEGAGRLASLFVLGAQPPDPGPRGLRPPDPPPRSPCVGLLRGVGVAGLRSCGHPPRVSLRSRGRSEAGCRRSPRDPRRGAAERTAGGLGDRLPPTLSALHAESAGRLASLFVLGAQPPGPGPWGLRPPDPPLRSPCVGSVAWGGARRTRSCGPRLHRGAVGAFGWPAFRGAVPRRACRFARAGDPRRDAGVARGIRAAGPLRGPLAASVTDFHRPRADRPRDARRDPAPVSLWRTSPDATRQWRGSPPSPHPRHTPSPLSG